MGNSKAKNLVWIVVDSARSYVSEMGDDRDKLDVMFDWSEYATDFSTALTSAPSSVMSISSMMTSIYPYYLGLNYDEFRYESEIFPSFPKIWESEGHEFHSICNSYEIRHLFREVLNPVNEKYYPDSLSDKKPNWSNKEVNDVLENFLKNYVSRTPISLFVWFNIREDSGTNSEVIRCMDLIRKSGIWDDSFVILTSDHGYLDPSRGFTPEKLKEMGLTHDNLISEDQIRIPLLLKYPGMKISKIKVPVFTIDILPTLLEYFNLTYPNNGFSMEGKSLIPLIKNPENDLEFINRMFRIDGRFMSQDGKRTSIRFNNYKYEFIHDSNEECFYRIDHDFFEKNNLINQLNPREKIAFLLMKKYFLETEKKSREFRIRLLCARFFGDIEKLISKKKFSKIQLFQNCSDLDFKLVEEIFAKRFENSMFFSNDNIKNKIVIKIQGLKSSYKMENISELREKIDFVIDIGENTKGSYKNSKNLNLVENFKRQLNLALKYKGRYFSHLLNRQL